MVRGEAHGSSLRGRKVTEAVICRWMAAISDRISLSDFSTLSVAPMLLSACRSKTHLVVRWCGGEGGGEVR